MDVLIWKPLSEAHVASAKLRARAACTSARLEVLSETERSADRKHKSSKLPLLRSLCGSALYVTPSGSQTKKPVGGLSSSVTINVRLVLFVH